jgi:hypothetical protein
MKTSRYVTPTPLGYFEVDCTRGKIFENFHQKNLYEGERYLKSKFNTSQFAERVPWQRHKGCRHSKHTCYNVTHKIISRIFPPLLVVDFYSFLTRIHHHLHPALPNLNEDLLIYHPAHHKLLIAQ